MKFNQNTKYDIVGIGATPLDTFNDNRKFS